MVVSTVERGKELPCCFVIMPFTDPEGYEEGHFRKVYEYIFKPAIEAAGFTAHRIDEGGSSSLIQAEIFEKLINAPMVLCDLSARNPNVLYELGVRHAFDKPVVLTQEEGQSHIFDISGVRTVSYRKRRLYEQVLEDQKEITKAILYTVKEEANYSFMKLVKMTRAVESNGSALSSRDRTEILVNQLFRKILSIDEKIDGIIPNNTTDAETDRRTNIQNHIVFIADNASQAIASIQKGKYNADLDQLQEIVNELDRAIFEYERRYTTNGIAVREARFVKQELLREIAKIRENKKDK